MRWVLVFAAGFLAVLCFHQAMFGLLHSAGIIPYVPYAMTPTRPFGVPAVLSGSFFGGLWALVLVMFLDRFGHGWKWLKAALFGGIVLTLVALLIVLPLKGAGVDLEALPRRFAIGFILNACWAVGTLVFLRAFGR